MAEFVIVTGLSGAGRSQAGATFEDLGWFVVDNLPTALILNFAALATAPESGSEAEVSRTQTCGEVAAAPNRNRAVR